MNPIHLETLLAVLDEGSFDAAADFLHITPSAVSQRIKALEQQTGRVLVRRTSPAEATEAGEVIAQAARRMRLLQAETFAQLTGRLAKVPLSIAINADSLATWFVAVMEDVAHWGGASLRVRIEDEAHSLTLLRRGDCLGAVTRVRQPVAGCLSVRLGTMKSLPVAAPWLKDKFTSPSGVLDWAGLPALRYGPKDMLQDSDLKGRVKIIPRERVISEIPSSEGFLNAAIAGLGWALIPRIQAQDALDDGRLVTLDDEERAVTLYWQHWRLESPVLKQLTMAVKKAATAQLDSK